MWSAACSAAFQSLSSKGHLSLFKFFASEKSGKAALYAAPQIEKVGKRRSTPHSKLSFMIENLEQQLQDSAQPTEEFRPLDPRAVKLWRTTYLIVFGIVIVAMLVVVIAVGWKVPSSRIWLALGWLALAALCLWLSFWHPPRYYSSWRWRIDAKVLEIRSGRLVESTRLIPLVRLQHVDLQRGPLERMFGLASLIIHTAGTHAASTTIPGLEAEEAARLRDHLIEIGGDDAV